MTLDSWVPLACGLITSAILSAAPLPGAVPAVPTPTAIQSFTLKGSESGARTFERGTFEVWCEFPDKFVRRTQVTHDQKGPVASAWSEDIHVTVLGFNGDQVVYEGSWPGGRQTAMGYVPPDLHQADVQPLLPYARRDFALLAELLFQGDARVLVSDAVWDRVHEWAKVPPLSSTAQVPLAIRGDYGDYRLIDGVRVPFRITHAAAEQEWTLDSIRWNVQLDAKKFKPTGEASSASNH
jgi:hypothetical protein